MKSQAEGKCKYIDRFPLSHQLIMRTGWYGFITVGLVGIAMHSLVWAGVYFIISLAGFALAVMPSICAHCPYPTKYDSCLFLPPAIVRKLYPYRGPEESLAGKILTIISLIAIIAFPQPWLSKNSIFLTLFWLICLPSIAAFPLFYCKRCRHKGCPLNSAATDSI